MNKIVLVALILFFLSRSNAQTYAPPAGIIGSSAIHMDSSVFVNWATSCNVIRGLQDISNASLGFASAGDSSMVIGKAQTNGVVSLGDGGTAICKFQFPIVNGSGYDFAVFENSFDDTFLELAFVEVSSDGIHFFRFPSHSKTDTINQTGSFGPTDATKINNFAGKYRGGYGTPFDLQELATIQGLNINAISHVKVIDVVGSLLKPFATHDSFNNKVNDPWPTPFPSSGFDLDAIGVINQSNITGIEENASISQITIFPNPLSKNEILSFYSNSEILSWRVVDAAGRLLMDSVKDELNFNELEQGSYFISIQTKNGTCIKKLIIP